MVAEMAMAAVAVNRENGYLSARAVSHDKEGDENGA